MKTCTREWLAVVGPLFLAGSAWAQGPQAAVQPASQPGITAEQVMERNIVALGGREALQQIQSYVLKASLADASRGLRASLEVYAQAPDKQLMVTTIQGVGPIRQGYDGRVAWSQNPYQGLRTLQGEELEITRQSAVFNPELRWRELFTKAELISSTGDALVICLTRNNGLSVDRHYDKRTFLLLQESVLYDGPQGRFLMETTYGDYRDVGGTKVAFDWKQKTPAGEAIVKVVEVRYNEPIETARFSPPATP